MPKGVYPKLSRNYPRPERMPKPDPPPLVFPPEYRELVYGILREKRKRELIESYRNLA